MNRSIKFNRITTNKTLNFKFLTKHCCIVTKMIVVQRTLIKNKLENFLRKYKTEVSNKN